MTISGQPVVSDGNEPKKKYWAGTENTASDLELDSWSRDNLAPPF